jgi:FixJ family two-component response regulator
VQSQNWYTEEPIPTVIVVDDDTPVRNALARLIHSAGLRVEAFATAQEFLAYAPPDEPACLVLDVWLSGENGLRLQDALQHSERCLPIVFLTGHGTVPMCARALKAGAVDFLQKPCDDEVLLQAISTALDQDRRTRHTRHRRAVLHRRVTTLTPREREVMGLVVTGLLNKQMAYILGTSEKTVKVHRARVMQKMQATSLADLVRMADTVGVSVPQERRPETTHPPFARDASLHPV